MTTYRLYRCNLCGDYISPSDGSPKEGFGLHFVTGGEIVIKRVTETEKHICHHCAQAVHDALRKIMPAEVSPRKGAGLDEGGGS